MDEDAELYVVLEDLQDSKLLGFLVAEFQELKPWNSDKEKAWKLFTVNNGRLEKGF